MHRFPRKAWARACLKAGLYIEKPDSKHPKKTRKVPAIRFHDLRHCMGTVLAEAGVEQRLIQELLGLLRDSDLGALHEAAPAGAPARSRQGHAAHGRRASALVSQ